MLISLCIDPFKTGMDFDVEQTGGWAAQPIKAIHTDDKYRPSLIGPLSAGQTLPLIKIEEESQLN